MASFNAISVDFFEDHYLDNPHWRTPPPPRVQILSFRHKKYAKRNRLGSPRPSPPPHNGKSWIRHWSIHLAQCKIDFFQDHRTSFYSWLLLRPFQLTSFKTIGFLKSTRFIINRLISWGKWTERPIVKTAALCCENHRNHPGTPPTLKGNVTFEMSARLSLAPENTYMYHRSYR